jgi:ribosomal protein L32
MAVPKKKTSKSKNKMRQAGKGLSKKNNIRLDATGKPVMSHVIKIERVKKEKKQSADA